MNPDHPVERDARVDLRHIVVRMCMHYTLVSPKRPCLSCVDMATCLWSQRPPRSPETTPPWSYSMPRHKTREMPQTSTQSNRTLRTKMRSRRCRARQTIVAVSAAACESRASDTSGHRPLITSHRISSFQVANTTAAVKASVL